MKIRITNVCDRAARTILVLGSFAIPAAVLAQTAPYLPGKPASRARGGDETQLLSPTAMRPRVVEKKVELAWLADPVTFPWRLEARTVGSRLEVHGQVPNEVALRHALTIAHAESGMPVVNQVQLNAALRMPTHGKQQEVLHREAFNVLRKSFPGQASSITVSTLADGEVVLKGVVATYEEKLAISRQLRESTPCSAVRNELRVLADSQGSLAQSHSHPAAAASASLERPKPEAVQPVGHVLSAELATTGSVSHSSVETTATKGTPAGLQGAATAAQGSSTPPFTNQPSAASAHPAQGADHSAKPTAKPLVYQTKWRRLDPSEVAMPKPVVPAATSKEPVRTTNPDASATPRTFLRVIPSPAVEPANSSSSIAATKAETTPASKPAVHLPSTPIQPVGTGADLSAGKAPHSSPSTAIPSPTAAPAPRPAALAVAKREPYISEGVILVESAIKPASYATSAPAQKPPAIVRTGSYVTSGVILFTDSTNEERLNANPALRALQTHLQQRIASVCGKSHNDIEVTAVTETNIAVRVRARSTLEGEELSNRIFQLPELASYHVSLDVLVMK